MATTTNYGWTTPDDTALVKDGASAIRTLGSSVDTSVKALNPGTTAGDIDYYTAATTKARIGIGSTGQVLTVNSGIPSWQTPSSGSLTLLSTTSLSGATTTISSISQSYSNLYVLIYGATNATSDNSYLIAPNGSSSITSFAGVEGTTTGGATAQGVAAGYLYLNRLNSAQRTNANNAWALTIYDYASTTRYKPITYSGQYRSTSGGTSDVGLVYGGNIVTNSAITSLVFSNSGGNLSTGTVLIYGVK
jgi:hypothetical protein